MGGELWSSSSGASSIPPRTAVSLEQTHREPLPFLFARAAEAKAKEQRLQKAKYEKKLTARRAAAAKGGASLASHALTSAKHKAAKRASSFVGSAASHVRQTKPVPLPAAPTTGPAEKRPRGHPRATHIPRAR